MNNLADRVDKVCNLKLQIESMEEENTRLQLLLNDGDYSSQKQISFLEKDIENVSILYHQAASENSKHKVDLQISEKKLKNQQRKITKLEKCLADLKTENKKVKKIALTLKKAVQQDRNTMMLDNNNLTGVTSSGRVVKKIYAGSNRKTVHASSS